MKKVKLISSLDDCVFVKSLKPFRTGTEREAMIFSYDEAERVLYLYGIDNDFEIYEVEF